MSDQFGMALKVFDCVLYDGEIDALAIRLHELDEVVDWFIIVESTLTFSGLPRAISLDPGDPRITRFAARFRHIIVADMATSEGPRQRESWQRNAVLRGIPDAAPDDLVILSNVDEIPRAVVVREMVRDLDTTVFGLKLGLFYFFVNYRNVEGPEAAITRPVAARRCALNTISPSDLRYAVRHRRVPARIINNAGWHFSYLMDEVRVRRKISTFSDQEYNIPAVRDKIDIGALVQRNDDLFQRSGFVWALVDAAELPEWPQTNRDTLRHLFAPAGPAPRRSPRAPAPPVVICPYLLEREGEEIRAKFDLDSVQGATIPFFLWQDRERIGPERAFELCWDRFPDRDIIIMHSDMAPFPGDAATFWYDALCDYRSLRPDAGMVAANLFYPPAGSDTPLRVQCAGGTFREETIGHLHGEVDGIGGVPLYMLESVRPVDWVTFAGVLIRREVIRACGGFDRRYQWAYYMDCDYSFEARLRGFRLLQVPVRLQHEESRSTRPLAAENPELVRHADRNKLLFSEKWRPLLSALPSEEALSGFDIITNSTVSSISSLDTRIFAIQPGDYSDKVSFLRIQRLMRELKPGYTYLEVGSDLGGSLLPHLLDPNCDAAISIDPRPELQPDERGVDFIYLGNSTKRMLSELDKHSRPHELGKLSTIEADISAIDWSHLTIHPQLVLIDGEHTNVAAFSDFMGVLPLIIDDALVTFRHANVISDVIQMIERFLEHAKTPYSLIILPSCVAVFGFGTFIRPMEIALRPYAEPTAAYYAEARKQRHEAVADAVVKKTEGLRGRSIRELVAATELTCADIARLQQALDVAKAANADKQVLIDAFTASTSWRVTAPIRAAVRLLRRRGA